MMLPDFSSMYTTTLTASVVPRPNDSAAKAVGGIRCKGPRGRSYRDMHLVDAAVERDEKSNIDETSAIEMSSSHL